jgi:hypothetical protein
VPNRFTDLQAALADLADALRGQIPRLVDDGGGSVATAASSTPSRSTA